MAFLSGHPNFFFKLVLCEQEYKQMYVVCVVDVFQYISNFIFVMFCVMVNFYSWAGKHGAVLWYCSYYL